MFESESRIAARAFALQALVDAQRGVNGDVTVGVRADLPAGQMRFVAVRVQLFLRHHQNAVVIGTAFIGNRKPRSALRNRAVANQLHGAHTDPLVAEPRADARLDHRIDVAVIDETVGAIQQVAGIPGVLISTKIIGSALRFMSGGDSGFGKHFGNEFDALTKVVAVEMGWNHFLKKCVRALGDAAARFSRCPVAIDLSAGRVGGFFVDAGLSKRQGIRIGGVAAAMLNMNRVIGNGGIQIGHAQGAAFLRFCIVVFEAQNPFPGWSFRGAFAQGRLYGGN